MGIVAKADASSSGSLDVVEIWKKATITLRRNRRPITISLYVTAICLLAVLVYDPTYLDVVLPFAGLSVVDAAADAETSRQAMTTQKPSSSQTVRKVFDLPFVPRDYLCDEMHLKAGRNFSYPEGYMDHADAYKSALSLNNIVEEASPNEQSWILQDLAQLPFARTACETGFNAGHHAFHFLTANYDLVVHSFENLRRFNYTLEMTDFMIIEFPDRFFVYDGEPRQSIAKFVAEHANRTSCDIVFVDSSQPRDVIRDYFRSFRSLATRADNVVVMNAHPKNVNRNPYAADEVWEEMRRDGVLVEQFRCYYTEKDVTTNQMGLLVGSFVF